MWSPVLLVYIIYVYTCMCVQYIVGLSSSIKGASNIWTKKWKSGLPKIIQISIFDHLVFDHSIFDHSIFDYLLYLQYPRSNAIFGGCCMDVPSSRSSPRWSTESPPNSAAIPAPLLWPPLAEPPLAVWPEPNVRPRGQTPPVGRFSGGKKGRAKRFTRFTLWSFDSFWKKMNC